MGVEPGRAPTAPLPRRAPGRGDPRRPGPARLRRPRRHRNRADCPPAGHRRQGPSWYLVSSTEAGRRTFRIDRVSSVDPTGDPVHRPDDFDLAESWCAIADEVERRRTPTRPGRCAYPTG
ncbi:WYL domain-containing protein [Luedemannella flava]